MMKAWAKTSQRLGRQRLLSRILYGSNSARRKCTWFDHKFGIYELNSLERKVAYVNLLTPRGIFANTTNFIFIAFWAFESIAERTRRHREDIKKIKRCIEYSLGRRPNEPERKYDHKIMARFALVYGTHRGFKKRARDRMLVHASLCVFLTVAL